MSIVGVGGTHHPVLGVIEIDIKYGTLRLTYAFYVIEKFTPFHYIGS